MVMIPASQVKLDLNAEQIACLELKCLDLQSVIPTIISRICSSDLQGLDFDCLTPASTVTELYQLLINQVCSLQSQTFVVPVYDLEYCKTSTWACGDSACLVLPASPDGPTNEDIMQTMVTRIVDLSTIVSDLCARLTAAEATIAAQQTLITDLQTNCCP